MSTRFPIAQSTAAAVVCLASQVATADDRWSAQADFRRSDASSIKVHEPDGYKVTIKIGDEVISDTVPSVFKTRTRTDSMR